tara:strand:+ start:403 stop:750 length:348 start_codon:yes stop_codon:yes gene_type:complete
MANKNRQNRQNKQNKQNKSNKSQKQRNRRRNRTQRGGMFAGALEALALPAGFFLAHKATQHKRYPRALKKTLKRGVKYNKGSRSLSLKGGNRNRQNKNRNRQNKNRNRQNKQNKN